MKLIIFLIGLVLAVWVGHTVYAPVHVFVTDIQKVYLQSKVIQNTAAQKSWTVLNALTDKYREIARVFWIEVAEEEAKKAISSPVPEGKKDPIEKLFGYNIALWISVGAGCMALSIYINILSFIAFFLKPITFLMKK